MDCRDFERWLDEGRPAGPRNAALSHQAACESCAASLAAARDVEDALRQRFATADDGFTDRVLRRLDAAPKPITTPLDDEPAVPWWVLVLQDRMTIGAFLIAAILRIWGADLWRTGELALPVASGALRTFGTTLTSLPSVAGLSIATMTLLVAPLLAVGSWFVYRAFSSDGPRRRALR